MATNIKQPIKMETVTVSLEKYNKLLETEAIYKKKWDEGRDKMNFEIAKFRQIAIDAEYRIQEVIKEKNEWLKKQTANHNKTVNSLNKEIEKLKKENKLLKEKKYNPLTKEINLLSKKINKFCND